MHAPRSLPLLSLSLLLAAALPACSDPPAPGTPVTFDTICSAQFDPTMEKGLNVTKRVTIEGYIGMKGMLRMCSDTCNIDLFSEPGGKGKRISASLTVGDGPNQLEKLPKEFSDKDVKVRTKDGKVVGVDTKVRITGGRAPVDGPGGPKRDTCGLWKVDLVEAI